jgi:LysR family transcriptional regulator, glycine cleavage system transcriptional activator
MNKIHMRRFRNIPPLQYLMGFEAAARLESFSKAAAELGLSQSAISHEMRLLEDRVGQALFLRQGRSVRLTDAGRDYQRSVAKSLEQLETGYRRLEPFRKPGSVVIYAPHDFAARWLLPRLGKLKEAVPLCDPWIDTSGTHVDFNEMEVSIAIVRAREVASHLVAQTLFGDALVPVAKPTLVNRPIKNPVDLKRFPLIHDERSESWNEWFESAGVEVDEVSAGLDFSDSDLALQAALQGLGIALASLPLVQDLLVGAKLIQVSTSVLQTGHGWYAVSTSKELSEPITKNTWDWLADVSVQTRNRNVNFLPSEFSAKQRSG